MDHLHKIAAEIVQLYHKQLNLLVLCNIAGLKVADLIDYERGKKRIQQLRRELEAENHHRHICNACHPGIANPAADRVPAIRRVLLDSGSR